VANRTLLVSGCAYYCFDNPMVKEVQHADKGKGQGKGATAANATADNPNPEKEKEKATAGRGGRCAGGRGSSQRGDTLVLERVGWTLYPCRRLAAAATASTAAVRVTTDGSACIFPFSYHGVSYTDCTPADSSNTQAWCSTHTAPFWGNCAAPAAALTAASAKQCKNYFTSRAPVTAVLGQGEAGEGPLVKGADISLHGMCPGDIRELRVPAKLGYGAQGLSGGGEGKDVPPNAALFFQIALLQLYPTHRPGYNLTAKLRNCSRGQWWAELRGRCLGCPAGKHQPLPAQRGCYKCARGRHQPEEGQATCGKCRNGTTWQRPAPAATGGKGEAALAWGCRPPPTPSPTPAAPVPAPVPWLRPTLRGGPTGISQSNINSDLG
jgi:hypothetical protein